MSYESSDNELETLGKAFHEWRRNNPNSRYPKDLWDQALELTTSYGFDAVAKLTGYPPSYLRRKSERRLSTASYETQFVELNPNTPVIPQEVKLRIQKSGLMAEMSFQGDIEQIFPLLYSMTKGES